MLGKRQEELETCNIQILKLTLLIHTKVLNRFTLGDTTCKVQAANVVRTER